MPPDGPLDQPATILLAALRAGRTTSVELVEASLARIEAVNPRLNAFAFVHAEKARAAAHAADAARAEGRALGPLHGLPIALKDFTPTSGDRTTLGSHAFADWVPERDPVIWRRLRAAGAILLGKTMTPEFAHSSFTESPLWGITRNPWDPARTTGGSSGGAGAAVATGCVSLAEGTDMGGSVRIPAALCGVVGLKPSLGRIPMDILPTCFDQLSHFGPLARSVADAALFLAMTQGPDDADIQSLPPGPDPCARLGESLAGKRFALSIDLGFFAVHPEVEARVREAAAALADAGAEVEEVELGWTREIVDRWVDLWGVQLAAAYGHLLPAWRAKMTPSVAELMDQGLALGAVAYKRIEEVRTRAWHDLARCLAGRDALLCPTMALPAPQVGLTDGHFAADVAGGRFAGLDMTSPFNLTPQCPALSVPCGFTGELLPVGLQIVGRRYDDAGVLAVGAAFERLRPWADRWPPIG